MKKLSKKNQLPVLIVLIIVTLGAFGYFTYRMIMPSPAAASTKLTPKMIARHVVIHPSSLSDASLASVPDLDETPAPSSTMRDPFIVAAVVSTDNSKHQAIFGPNTPRSGPHNPASGLHFPGVEPLPPPTANLGALPSAYQASSPISGGQTAAQSLSNWTVTGVLQSGAEQIAVMRNGDARRFVHCGDLVDSEYRIVNVTRNSVTLRHGDSQITLPLGTPKSTVNDDKSAQNQAQGTNIISPANDTKPATTTQSDLGIPSAGIVSGIGATNARIN